MIKLIQPDEAKQNDIWYTLVGLCLLEQECFTFRQAWKLVSGKAKAAIVEQLGFSGDLQDIMDKIKVDLL